MPPGSTIHLRTLGAAALQHIGDDGATTTLLDSSKLLALLTYLNAAPARSATRDHLVQLLWSDLDEDGGRHALRHHLWLLKQKLADVVTIDRGETLTLREPIPCDRDELMAASAEGDLVQVVSLYRGDFFPNFAAVGAQEFEHWCERERTTLRSVFVRSGQVVVKQWLDLGRTRDAVALARRVRDTDAFDLGGWRLLLETLVAARDVVGAAVEVDALEHFAREEGVNLDGATRAVVASVKHPAAPAVTPDERVALLATRELVGREAEFAALVRRWDETVRGRLHGVHLTGPAGMGKTRLLQEFAARLDSMRRDVVHARADWASRTIEWSFASDLIGRLCSLPGALGVAPRTASVLVALAPAAAEVFKGASATANQATETVARRGALRELLGALSEERPLALLLDDMHWCDGTSRDVLFSALEGLDRHRLMVVVAERDQVARGVPRSFATLPLSPLSHQSVTTLVASIAQLPEEPWAESLCDRLARQVGGSPLHLLETLQLAVERGALRVVDSTWELGDMPLLDALLDSGEALRARVNALGARQRDCVQLLACVGAPLPLAIVAECTEVGEEALSGVVAELERSGIVRLAEGGVEIAHDEIAEAARRELSEEERRGLVGRAGVVMAHRGRDTATLARAASLLMSAGRDDDLVELCDRYVRRARRLGDRRSVDRLIAELLGLRTEPRERRALVARLPWWRRAGLDLPRRRWIAAAAVVASVAVAAAAEQRMTAGPEGLVISVVTTDSVDARTITRYLVPVGWERSAEPLALQRVGRPVRIDATDLIAVRTPPLDSLPILLARHVRDSGLTDLFEYRRDGTMHRLTFSPGDDVEPVWAPDGSAIAFATSRWDALGRRDVALLDRRTGRVTRVTSTPAREHSVHWSNDGTRIAFVRDAEGGKAASLCVAAADGEDIDCHALDLPATYLIGWTGDEEVLLAGQESVYPGAYRYDLRARTSTRLSDASGSYGLVRGVGMVCLCLDPVSGERQWTLRPLSRDGRFVELPFSRSGPVGVAEVQGGPRGDRAWLEAIEVADTVVIAAGVPHRVGASGRLASGARSALHALRWTSADTSAVAVTPSGELVGLREGAAVRVIVSAGGWRTASLVAVVRSVPPARLVAEDWRGEVGERWRLFGEPFPVVRRHADGTLALSNHGDSAYTSGAYSRQRFPLGGGLALRARLASHVTMTQWQTQRLELLAGFAEDRLAAWDHRTMYPWSEKRMADPRASCEFEYPTPLEGDGFRDRMTAAGIVISGAPPRLGSGDWFDVILQWLPDGRCAVMLDGRLLKVSQSIQTGQVARVITWGSSVNTEMLLGPLEVWRGVLPEVARALRSP